LKDNSTISQELLETIERYHNHTMPQVERQAFEQRIENDAEFKTLVNDIQTFLFGIEQQALEEKLEEFHEEMPIRMDTEQKASKARQFLFMKIAAAVVILIAVGSFWFLSGSSNERLYDNYFKPDPGLPTTMSSTDNYVFFDAMVDYKQGDYKKAISKWEALQQKEPLNDTINYFIGVANLAENNTDRAISFLNKTASKQESVFNTDANYYLGLAYLKKNDRETAIKFLKNSNTDQSKLLLDKLD
jgi:tetratricopeptide (TPR) repeat protein